ncbi:MAG TPA: hypothetical protein VKP30_04790, partial [Polyangiaceae bacterium]|nr:hypothetical protein [Polyangiaceae bacterium]
MADTTLFFVDMGNGPTGPFTVSQVLQLAQSGMIGAETPVSDSKESTPVPARDVPAFAEQFRRPELEKVAPEAAIEPIATAQEWFIKSPDGSSGPFDTSHTAELVAKHGDYIELAAAGTKTWLRPSQTAFAVHVPSNPVPSPANPNADEPATLGRPLMWAGILSAGLVTAVVASSYYEFDFGADDKPPPRPTVGVATPVENPVVAAVPQDALTAAEVQAMSSQARESRLLQECSELTVPTYCDSENVQVILASVTDPSEKARLFEIKKTLDSAAVAKLRGFLDALSRVHKKASSQDYEKVNTNGSPGSPCINASREFWSVVEPILSTLNKTALTLPG